MSSERKLTALQLETLALAREGKVVERRFGYGAWRIRGAKKHRNAAFERKEA